MPPRVGDGSRHCVEADDLDATLGEARLDRDRPAAAARVDEDDTGVESGEERERAGERRVRAPGPGAVAVRTPVQRSTRQPECKRRSGSVEVDAKGEGGLRRREAGAPRAVDPAGTSGDRTTDRVLGLVAAERAPAEPAGDDVEVGAEPERTRRDPIERESHLAMAEREPLDGQRSADLLGRDPLDPSRRARQQLRPSSARSNDRHDVPSLVAWLRLRGGARGTRKALQPAVSGRGAWP
jgi:hypothetical protein